MTVEQHDLTIRPITGPDELDLFCRLPYVLNAELADDLGSGRRQPGWMWVALHGGHLVARVGWWARLEGTGPDILDVFDIDDDAEHPHGVDIGARLLLTAMAEVIPADLTYGKLGSYATTHEISINGPPREYYLRGASDTPDPAEWTTEIGWPIFRADGRN